MDGKESLCAMSAMYLALFDTVKTKSQLLKMTYEDMRTAMFAELDMEPGTHVTQCVAYTKSIMS